MTPLQVLGWRECLALPDLGVSAIRAKVDTGARSSALHVDAMETFVLDGREWVRFSLDGAGDAAAAGAATLPVHDRRVVTDSGGHRTERVFVLTDVVLGGQRWTIEMNLSYRRNMLFPMLLGRTALAGRFLVDASQSYAFGGGPADTR